MLCTVSRDWLHDRAPTQTLRAQTSQQEDVDPALWRLSAELGRLGLGLPEEHGGTGQGLVELALVTQEIGRAAAPFSPPRSSDAGGVRRRQPRPAEHIADGHTALDAPAGADPGAVGRLLQLIAHEGLFALTSDPAAAEERIGPTSFCSALLGDAHSKLDRRSGYSPLDDAWRPRPDRSGRSPGARGPAPPPRRSARRPAVPRSATAARPTRRTAGRRRSPRPHRLRHDPLGAVEARVGREVLSADQAAEFRPVPARLRHCRLQPPAVGRPVGADQRVGRRLVHLILSRKPRRSRLGGIDSRSRDAERRGITSGQGRCGASVTTTRRSQARRTTAPLVTGLDDPAVGGGRVCDDRTRVRACEAGGAGEAAADARAGVRAGGDPACLQPGRHLRLDGCLRAADVYA
ncbi:acyl-CoA dehydrogenase family protein [Streptomyces sp. NPDC002928]|uniref:acyl-CoA dehydrogenase family protein n=1 Tax=Streptomyces sp. NPDC002928 TaxID=3154440 RepID=UPI0033A5995E